MRTPKPIFHIVLFETYVESVTQFYEFYVYRLYRLRKTPDVFGEGIEKIFWAINTFMQQFPLKESSQAYISHSFV